MSERKCKHCQKTLINTAIPRLSCYSCYGLFRKYGTITPDHFNRKCEMCGSEFFSKKHKAKFCSKICAKKNIAIIKWKAYRIENNIDLSIPKKFKKPNGSGHKEPHGYIYITKMRHPNSTKSGRIYEHTFVMSNHLGRPLTKGENVHHKNGIRDDNRIENLELWTTSQPAGQRVEDKIKWAEEFLEKYKDFKK
jgi:endogenous inhibitor of DNA gyrase (YacG/DUF329 family)